MEIEHYNAIAKIVGGTLDNNDRLHPMVNTLTTYFESVDENFNAKEFRSACLNGHFMTEKLKMDTTPVKEAITPVKVQNQANNWNPVETASVRSTNNEYMEATKRMNARTQLNIKNLKTRSK